MELISPKYRTHLIKDVSIAIWNEFHTYSEVNIYFQGWHSVEDNGFYTTENFEIIYFGVTDRRIDVLNTLNNIDSETLIKIAIDLGVETPDFIPSIPTFRNKIKEEYPTTSIIFEQAYKKIETEPEIAIGLANSALESIIKEILKDERINTKGKDTDTLYSLTKSILKEFKLLPTAEMPEEIKTIGSSLVSIAQGIEKMRSDKTLFHGKTDDDYVISDPMYVYFVVNSVCTVGMFLRSFYKKHYPKQQTIEYNNELGLEDLPF